jgi:tetratricopeptide (TPR) repeat protein
MNATRFLQACAAIAILALTGSAFGQVYVQQGNALDANPRMGSGGLNYGARQYPGSSLANRIVTGNVAGGAAFRGYSPIRDPSSFFFNNYASPLVAGTGLAGLANYNLSTVNTNGLPSSALTPFDRESINEATVTAPGYIPGTLSGRPYYSVSGTVTSTGAIIAGLNRPGTSQLITPYTPLYSEQRTTPINPLEKAPPSGSLLQVAPRLVRIDNGQPLSGPINQRLLTSPLFGAAREIPVNALAEQAVGHDGAALTPRPSERPINPEAQIAQQRAAQLEQQQLQQQQQQRRAMIQPGENQPTENEPTGGAAGEARVGRLRSDQGAGSLANTGEVFASMRKQTSSLARPTTGRPETTTLAQRPPRPGAGPAPGLIEREALGPLRTFAGTQGTALNRYLHEAEDLLKKGQYYRAAESYGFAQSVDPTNPLPLLGRSMSLLAAGDYMSSTNSLFTAIRLFESLSQYQVDMRAFIPEADVLENRQADLEKRLQIFNDFRLRFLLGYLQYSTGQRDAGLANMDAAAQQSPPEFASVRRFVAQLKERPQSPPVPATRPSK